MKEVKTFLVSLDNPDYKGGTGLKAFKPSTTAPKNIPMFIQAQVVLKSDYDQVVQELAWLRKKLQEIDENIQDQKYWDASYIIEKIFNPS